MYCFGLFEIAPQQAPQQVCDVASGVEVAYYQEAVNAPSRFAGRVLGAARQREGWATYGGMRLLNSLLGPNPIMGEFDEVCELAFSFLRSRNLNFLYLSRNEVEWWVNHHPNEDYLPRRPLPTREGAVSALAAGERRRVANMGPFGNNNDIYVVQATGGFQAVVQAPELRWNEASGHPWQRAETLYDLYVAVADALRSEPHWCDPELRAFVPLDAPDLSP